MPQSAPVRGATAAGAPMAPKKTASAEAEISLSPSAGKAEVAQGVKDASAKLTGESGGTEGSQTAVPVPPGPVFSWGGYVQALGILFLLMALLWLGVRFLRRYGHFNFMPRPGALPKDALVMEAQMPLGPRKGLMVVRFLNRRLLLGVTDQQISLLTEEPVEYGQQQTSFNTIMEQTRRNTGSAHDGDTPAV